MIARTSTLGRSHPSPTTVKLLGGKALIGDGGGGRATSAAALGRKCGRSRVGVPARVCVAMDLRRNCGGPDQTIVKFLRWIRLPPCPKGYLDPYIGWRDKCIGSVAGHGSLCASRAVANIDGKSLLIHREIHERGAK